MTATPYHIEITPEAQRNLRKLPREILHRIDTKLCALAHDPRPHGVVALRGNDRFLRLRVGDYRVVYEVRDVALLIVIIRIGHRREVYRGTR